MAEPDIVQSLKKEKATLTQQLDSLKAHVAMIEERLKVIDEALNNIAPLYEGLPYPQALSGPMGMLMSFSEGITEAVRNVYRSAMPNRYLSPTDVRDRLKSAGIQLEKYDNEMAVIHQIIRRLQDQGQIEAHPSEKTHRWIYQNALGIRGAARKLRDLKK